jgi:hypothetical protein
MRRSPPRSLPPAQCRWLSACRAHARSRPRPTHHTATPTGSVVTALIDLVLADRVLEPRAMLIVRSPGARGARHEDQRREKGGGDLGGLKVLA